MNTNLGFYKMTGSGNDFVFLDGRSTALEEWPAERIRAVCDRRSGVGADGVVILSPEGPDRARMVYFNADGSRAAMCGNAALCSTRLALRLGLAGPSGMRLETDSGAMETRCVGPGWAAELRLPDFEAPVAVEWPMRVAGEERMARTTVGVPHLVVLVKDVSRVDVQGRGSALRRDDVFAPEGVNVNFVGPEKGAEPGWRMRTYERGVEAETLACGTGTVAVAAALAGWGLDRLPVRIASWGGNLFSVAGTVDGGLVREPWLCGEGRLVFTGCFEDLGRSG